MRLYRLLLAGLFLFGPRTAAAQLAAGDATGARRALESARAEVRAASGQSAGARAERMIALGMWAEAEAVLAAERAPGADALVASARLHARRHVYERAAEAVQRALRTAPAHRAARVMRGQLEIQRWDLEAAARTAQDLLREQPRDEQAALLLGRVRLLEKQYDDALGIAREVQEWNPRNAGAFALEADVRFWNQDPAGAEPPLVRALELDPFDADARFNYGYAIWRRVDAKQLNAMAAQWDLALAVDPLHYITHWHWGNGHTNLTYADYAHPTDSIVRERLRAPDSLISRGQLVEAIRLTREVEGAFPASVLPAMMRGSAFYLDAAARAGASLDSAESSFRAILGRKPHYGPAHNGLAAVIKKRQFLFLDGIDSLEAAIGAVPLATDQQFLDVFADAGYYPGDRVRRMIRQQLGLTEAYVPFLHRLGQRFTIPPLHRDLAEAMNRPSFRFTTTFDNRQWMDIRGVGGGSTGIEYVERGSHWERNVLLHEYAHLFHGNVLTDAENRRIRALYHAAMAAGRTLDYYAANNESEFFAQAWEAYVMPKKVHPLNHKAMNTAGDLRSKDPELAAFVDSMATRLRAALAGDRMALRSNWAETYVNLARRASGSARAEDAQVGRAAVLLDSALVWDDRYLPAMVLYASVLGRSGRFAEASAWLDRANAIDAGYAPVYTGRAGLLDAQAQAGAVAPAQALVQRSALLARALEVEVDLAERAALNARLRELLADHGRLDEAIRVAEEYARTGPDISTYLRDRRDEASGFALELRASAGYAAEAAVELGRLVARKPFNYTHRAQYADALAAAGREREAIEVLEEAQRVLRAAGSPRPDYAVRVAELYLSLGRRDSALATVEPLLSGSRRPAGDARLARVLASLGRPEAAARALEALPTGVPRTRAEQAYTRGWIAQAAGDAAAAEREYRAALDAFDYHVPARVALLRLLRGRGGDEEARRLVDGAAALPLPLGPDFDRQADAPLNPGG